MRVVFLANTDWYLFNFRLDLAKAVRAAGHEVILAAPEGVFRREIENEGFRFQPVRMSRRGVNPLEEWGAVRRMEALYRRHRYTAHSLLGRVWQLAVQVTSSIPVLLNSLLGISSDDDAPTPNPPKRSSMTSLGDMPSLF